MKKIFFNKLQPPASQAQFWVSLVGIHLFDIAWEKQKGLIQHNMLGEGQIKLLKNLSE